MKIPTFILLFILVKSASAQETLFDSLTTPAPTKNELYFNIAPVFKTLLSTGPSDIIRYSVGYKRSLNERSAIRLSFLADFVGYKGFKPSIEIRNGPTYFDNNNVLAKIKGYSPGYNIPRIAMGYERIFGKRKLKCFYGGDLSLGYAKREFYLIEYTVTIDNNGRLLESNPREVYRERNEIYLAGVSPFFGLKYPFSNRLSVSLQFGMDLTYEKRMSITAENSGTQKYTSSYFDANMNTGILNDISLVYKF